MLSNIIEHIRAKIYYYCENITYISVMIFFLLVLIVIIGISFFGKQRNPETRRSIVYSVLLAFMVTVIAAVTVLGRKNGIAESSATTLFLTYTQFLKGKYWVLYDLVFNIILFIPLGILLRFGLKSKTCMIITFLLSLGIELIQLLTGRGVFEISDIIDNFLGGVLGIIIYESLFCLFRKTEEYFH